MKWIDTENGLKLKWITTFRIKTVYTNIFIFFLRVCVYIIHLHHGSALDLLCENHNKQDNVYIYSSARKKEHWMWIITKERTKFSHIKILKKLVMVQFKVKNENVCVSSSFLVIEMRLNPMRINIQHWEWKDCHKSWTLFFISLTLWFFPLHSINYSSIKSISKCASVSEFTFEIVKFDFNLAETYAY